MENLRIVLIVIASLIILAFLINGFKTNKKESKDIFDEKNKDKTKNSPKEFHDNEPKIDLVQPKRSNETPAPTVNASESQASSHTAQSERDPLMERVTPQPKVEAMQPTVNQEPVQQPEPKTVAQEQNETVSVNVANSEPAPTIKSEVKQPEPAPQAEQPAPKKKKTDIIILYVTAFAGKYIEGSTLLSSMTQLGFKYGDMSIYHRHMDPAGNEPVLFSLCNMIEPATFNPDTIHELKTPGVAIFMQVPSHGDNLQNFKLMLQAAQQIAEVNNGQVLDEKKHLITPEAIKNYQTRIRAAIA